jgi:hypothetical protein
MDFFFHISVVFCRKDVQGCNISQNLYYTSVKI